MDFNAIIQALLKQSVTAVVLLFILYHLAKWVKELLKTWMEQQRQDMGRCFDLHEKQLECINNNTDALHALKDKILGAQ